MGGQLPPAPAQHISPQSHLMPSAPCMYVPHHPLQGLGLACLGKRGIQGKLLRRVMAPGTPMANQLGKGVEGSMAEAMAAAR